MGDWADQKADEILSLAFTDEGRRRLIAASLRSERAFGELLGNPEGAP